jgi:tRNA-specific 2-thiouridylase
MSGGVDSSVSALLLKEAGYRVVGLFMKNWEEADGVCRAAEDADDVARVADLLQIPHYTVSFVEEYRRLVFDAFLRDLEAGRTPNPDVLCNREIKFDAFLKKALLLGADKIATGHYCRLDGACRLLKGSDPGKDQSYFLHAVPKGALEKTVFPIGHLRKEEVRRIARAARLPTAEKKDSTGICFIGERNFKTFLAPYLGYSKGPLKTCSGAVVGTHDGAAYYTIGQRRGLGLGGEGEAWFVVGKEISSNTVYVERGENHPALFSSSLTAQSPTWLGDPPSFPYRCAAKIRYRQSDQLCTVSIEAGGNLRVDFDEPQRAITPGQAVVFYDGEVCLGGATIDS